MPVIDAIQQGDLNALRSALRDDPKQVNATTPDGVPAVLLALYYRRPEAASLLLEAGAKLDPWIAAALGRTTELGAFLDQDPAIIHAHSPDGWTLLHLAAFFGQEEAARLLLYRGAQLEALSANAMANLPLHAASAGRHPHLVALLLESGSPANAAQRGGYTPLHSAAQNNDLASAAALVKHGADRAAVADDGKTPIELARTAGHSEMLALLLAE